MKIPALLVGSALLVSMFMFSAIPIFSSVDHLVSDPDNGWEEETRITESRRASYDPVVKADGLGNTQVVWTGENTGTPQIYYAKFNGQGKPVVPVTKITKNGAPSGMADMAIGPDGTITMVFVDGREGNWNIYMKQISDDGIEITPAIPVSNIPFGSTAASIISDHGDGTGQRPSPWTVNYPAEDHSGDGGSMQTIQTGTEAVEMRSYSPSVITDSDGYTHIVWADSRTGNFELYYSMVTPKGEMAVSELELTQTRSSSLRPLLAIDPDGDLCIVWEEVSQDVTRIHFMRLGASHTVLEEELLATTTTESLGKDIVMDDQGTMHMVWSDEISGTKQVWYMSFDEKGRTLWSRTALTPPGGEADQPAITMDNDRLHIVFIHEMGSNGGQIYYKNIDLSTGNISMAFQLVPNAWTAHNLDIDWGQVSYMEANGELYGRVRLVWADNRDGKDDIFMTQATTQHNLKVESSVIETGSETTSNPNALMAVGGLLGVGLALATDVGKWATGAAFLPLYSRLKRTKILDQSVRDQIFNRVKCEPGVNFTGLMKALDLKNGVLSYHLSTLEREEYIRSCRDGVYRRYYPRINGYCKLPKEIHDLMVDVIFEKPGITQSTIAKKLKKSRQVINYHIKQMVASGTIKVERHGRSTRCYISNWTI